MKQPTQEQITRAAAILDGARWWNHNDEQHAAAVQHKITELIQVGAEGWITVGVTGGVSYFHDGHTTTGCTEATAQAAMVLGVPVLRFDAGDVDIWRVIGCPLEARPWERERGDVVPLERAHSFSPVSNLDALAAKVAAGATLYNPPDGWTPELLERGIQYHARREAERAQLHANDAHAQRREEGRERIAEVLARTA